MPVTPYEILLLIIVLLLVLFIFHLENMHKRERAELYKRRAMEQTTHRSGSTVRNPLKERIEQFGKEQDDVD